MTRSKWTLGARLSWVLGALWKAMAAYAVSGALMGAAIGCSNWAKSPLSKTLWQTVAFTTVAGAVWWAIFAVLVTLPLFFCLFAALPTQSQAKARQKEVFIGLIFPCAVLQVAGPLLVGALYLSIPPIQRALQGVVFSSDFGDVLARSSWAFMLLGSWAGAAWVISLWRAMAASELPGVSRLLPLD